MPDLSDTIASEAILPAASADDGQSATARPIADLIAADKYLAGKAASANRRRGIRFSQIVTPGAGGYCGDTSNFNNPCGGC